MKKFIIILLFLVNFYEQTSCPMQTQEETKFNIGMLPNEVLESIILDLLDTKTAQDAVDNLLAFASTNKQFYQLINQNPFVIKTTINTLINQFKASEIINYFIVRDIPAMQDYLQENPEILLNLIEKLLLEENNLNIIIDSFVALNNANSLLRSLINNQKTINLIQDKLQKKHKMDPLYYLLLLSQLEGIKNYINQNYLKFQPLERGLYWAIDPYSFAKLSKWEFDRDLKIQLAMLNMLKELGANMNKVVLSNTPLMLAIDHNEEAMVAYLLTIPEIDIERRNNKGKTALNIAEKKGNKNIIKMLEKALEKKGAFQ
ncbi:MAG: ankyrin repeat domain-containing protein [Candidatus Babeliales bacterium]